MFCTAKEVLIKEKIIEKLGRGTNVEVTDLSSGCGTMFHIKVASPVFNGKSLIDQHRMVNNSLMDQEFHGLRLETSEVKEQD